MLLSSALQAASGDVASQAGDLPVPTHAQAKKALRLAPSHRARILRQYLTDGITIAAAASDTSGALKVTLTYRGKSFFLEGDIDPKVWRDRAKKVRSLMKSRGNRLAEIQLQQGEIMSFLTQGLRLSPATHGRLLEFLGICFEAIVDIETRVKMIFNILRPVDFFPEIAPPIQTPEHSAFPSGHATEAFGLAILLSHLVPAAEPKFTTSKARRIAENRVYAGVHYQVDNTAGAYLGKFLAAVMLDKAGLKEFAVSLDGYSTIEGQTPAPTAATGSEGQSSELNIATGEDLFDIELMFGEMDTRTTSATQPQDANTGAAITTEALLGWLVSAALEEVS